MEAEAQANTELLEEEFVGLEAIFGNDVRIERKQCPLCEVHVPSVEASTKVVVQFRCSSLYPSSEAPQISVIAHHLEADVQHWIQGQLESLFQPNVPVIYECIEWLQNHPELYEVDPPVEEPPMPAAVSVVAVNNEVEESMKTRVIHGEPFTEKKSTFQATAKWLLACISSVVEVERMMKYLLLQNKVNNATHNILAYRISNPVTQGYIQDCDDDGETAAGGRLLHLLQVAKVENIAVCVSRWYGGIRLGPARFSHINNAARTLLVEQGYISTAAKKKT